MIDRRTVVLGGATAVAAAVAGAVVAGTAAGLGRVVDGARSPGSHSVTLRPGGAVDRLELCPDERGTKVVDSKHDGTIIDSGHDGVSGDSDWLGQPGADRWGCAFHRSEDK